MAVNKGALKQGDVLIHPRYKWDIVVLSEPFIDPDGKLVCWTYFERRVITDTAWKSDWDGWNFM
jgi:hypothetical protein